MKRLIASLIIISATIVIIGTGCGISINPRATPPVNIYDRQVDVLDVFCPYGDSSEFPFRFTLKNLNNEDNDVSYTWSLNDPMADKPVYEGQGEILLPASGEKEVDIQIEKNGEYDPRGYVMYVYVYRSDKQVGYYREQKSTYDWDYSVTPPIKRSEKPSYKHVWIDTFIEKTSAGYQVNIDDIIFLPPERKASLELDNICISGGRLLADMLADNANLTELGFHDVDNNGELTVGDYLLMDNSFGGDSIEFDSRDEPSIHINNISYPPETIEEENRDAIRLQNVEYIVIDETTLEIEVKVASDKPLKHVDAKYYAPGETGISSGGDHLEPPVVVKDDTLVYRKEVEHFLRDGRELYLLVYITDGTNELLYNAGKLP